MIRHTPRGGLWLVVGLLLAAPQRGFAWTDEVRAAIEEVAAKGDHASPRAKAIAFAHNQDLNMMAEQGKIDRQVYQKAQDQFSKQAFELVNESARDAGVGAKPQSADLSKPNIAKPGTDIDGHLIPPENNPKQQLTAKDVANARQAFNDRVNAYLKANNVPPLENPSKQLTVDMMPARNISQAEATHSAEFINKEGGVMYRDQKAGIVEAFTRGEVKPFTNAEGKVVGPSLMDWARYVSEQQRQVMTHDNINHLTGEISEAGGAPEGSQEWAAAQTKKGLVQLEAEQTGKYQDRINRTAETIGKQFSGDPAPEVRATAGTDAASKVTKDRGPEMAGEAAQVEALREHTTLVGTKNFVEQAARAAEKDPKLRAEAAEAIAEVTRNLSPAERAQVLENIKRSPALGGEEAATRVVDAMRKNPLPDGPSVMNSRNVTEAAAGGSGTGIGPAGNEPPGGMIGKADAAVGKALGIGELGAEAGLARQGLNVGGKALGGAGLALAGWEVGKNAGEYAEGMDRALDPHSTDAEANQAFAQADKAAQSIAIIGGAGAAAAASPVVIGGALTGVGAYLGTRHVLEHTETGRAIDQAVLNGMDKTAQAPGSFIDWVKQTLGLETQEAQELKARQDAYRQAIERGQIQLQPGSTIDDLMKHLEHPDSKDYLAGLAGLVKKPGQPGLDDGVGGTTVGGLEGAGTAPATIGAILDGMDCSAVPGAVPMLNPSTQQAYCGCVQGEVFDAQRGCISQVDSQMASMDCSGYPGTVAGWDQGTQMVRCLCAAGQYWNAAQNGCASADDVATGYGRGAAPVDCGAWPGTAPQWNPYDNQFHCNCPGNTYWSSGQAQCIGGGPEPVEATQNSHCSQWPGTSPQWNSVTGAWQCGCPAGMIWRESEFSCVNVPPGFEQPTAGATPTEAGVPEQPQENSFSGGTGGVGAQGSIPGEATTGAGGAESGGDVGGCSGCGAGQMSILGVCGGTAQ